MASNTRYQATFKMQEQARRERKFEKTESDLSSAELSSAVPSKLGTVGRFRNVLSYLGTRNPFPQAVTAEDTVWLFDNTAYRTQTGKWESVCCRLPIFTFLTIQPPCIS